jgi:hypothetical protein
VKWLLAFLFSLCCLGSVHAQISLSDIGHNSAGSATSVAVTGVNVSAGTTLYIITAGSYDSVSDGTNSFTKLNSGASPVSWYFYYPTSQSGLTITATVSIARDLTIQVEAITGSNGIPDSNVSTDNTGTTSSVSITGAGTAAVAGELNIATIAWSSSFITLGSASWPTPPPLETYFSSTKTEGGNQINSGTSPQTYTATLSTNHAWNAMIDAFEPGSPPPSTNCNRMLLGVGC